MCKRSGLYGNLAGKGQFPQKKKKDTRLWGQGFMRQISCQPVIHILLRSGTKDSWAAKPPQNIIEHVTGAVSIHCCLSLGGWGEEGELYFQSVEICNQTLKERGDSPCSMIHPKAFPPRCSLKA